MDDDVIVKSSLKEARKKREHGETLTRPDAPEYEPDGAFWCKAKVIVPDGPKVPLKLRLDPDMVDWFKSKGKGYQTRMNAVLRAYYEAHRNDPA